MSRALYKYDTNGRSSFCTLLYGTSYEYERYRNRSTVECMPQLFIVQYEPAAVSLLLYTTYCCTLILEYDIIRYERSSSCISTAVRHVVQTCASHEYKRTAPLLNACHSCLNYDTNRLLHHCCCTHCPARTAVRHVVRLPHPNCLHHHILSLLYYYCRWLHLLLYPIAFSIACSAVLKRVPLVLRTGAAPVAFRNYC